MVRLLFLDIIGEFTESLPQKRQCRSCFRENVEVDPQIRLFASLGLFASAPPPSLHRLRRNFTINYSCTDLRRLVFVESSMLIDESQKMIVQEEYSLK